MEYNRESAIGLSTPKVAQFTDLVGGWAVDTRLVIVCRASTHFARPVIYIFITLPRTVPLPRIPRIAPLTAGPGPASPWAQTQVHL